mmetsp:Transcript_33819/g.32928  ORF Transcript_33819/g.32928 Transcript_33819/m.32928 type:complete len:144 (+) Transcript_33819:140-571(+)
MIKSLDNVEGKKKAVLNNQQMSDIKQSLNPNSPDIMAEELKEAFFVKQNDIKGLYEIDAINSDKVKVKNYRIIEIALESGLQNEFSNEQNEMGMKSNFMAGLLSRAYEDQSNLSRITVREIATFNGPSCDDNSNYGLYVSDDL